VSATVRGFAKRLLAHGLVDTGGWAVVLRAWARQDSTVVLTYHRLLEKWEPALDYSQPGMVVTVPTFERQLEFLARHFDVVPLGALVDGPAPGATRRPRCVITFDDGWRDNYELAFPILRKLGVPATIFLTTDFIATERVFWHTELIHLLLFGNLARFVSGERALAGYPSMVRDAIRRCTAAGRASSAADTDAVVETVKARCGESRINDLIDTLARAAGLHRPLLPGRRFFLDWDQVREMAAGGVEIGSHGCSHKILTRLPTQDAKQELVKSKAEIESRLDRPVLHFAFPNDDANPALVALAARTGYRTACVGAVGDVAPPPGIRALRRVGMHEGVASGDRGHDDALLGLALLRAPRSRPA
jgi:peptidoglycan/xylan/chitin deacetylase (PgdA/CDA1 family)